MNFRPAWLRRPWSNDYLSRLAQEMMRDYYRTTAEGDRRSAEHARQVRDLPITDTHWDHNQ